MQNKQSTDKMLLGAIIVSMLLWGFGWPSGKVLTHYTSAVNFSVYRYTIVITILSVIMLFRKVSFPVKKEGIPSILISGGLLALYSYFFYMGLKTGSAGAGGVLVTTLNPIVAYAIGILLTRKMPAKNEVIGLVLGTFAGSILLKLWSNGSAIADSGNLYFLAAAFTWAVMSKFTSKGSRYGSSLSFSLWQYLITLLCLLPLMDVNEFKGAMAIRDPLFWGNLIFSSAFVTALATTIYFFATTKLGAEKASSFIFMVPLAAALSSWLFIGEKILPHTIIGGILGIAAVYLINKKPKTVAQAA
jgi:drug/metabolite transporter (DMT)-like permease